MKPVKDAPWRRWGLPLLLLLAAASCLPPLHPTGAPCQEDGDCWSSAYVCVQGTCADKSAPPEPRAADASEPGPEPRTEPQAREAPDQAVEARPEARPEPRPEPTPQKGRKLYESCAWYDWARDDEKCNAGLLCVRVTGTAAFCLRDCTRGDCSDKDRSTCRTVDLDAQGAPLKACVKIVAASQPCDRSRGLFCKIEGASGSICKANTCVAVKVADLRQPCDPTADPTPTVCDPTQGLYCSGSKTCAKGRQTFEFDRCDKQPCPLGLSCSQGSEQVCIYRCLNDDDCRKSEVPSTCYNGICFQTGCKGNFDCKHRSAPPVCQSNNGKFYCFLKNKEHIGAVQFGDYCKENATLSQDKCAGSLRCLIVNAGKGFCTEHCLDDDDCKAWNPRYSCAAQNKEGLKFCGLTCKSVADCPPGEKCYNGLVCGPP